jgi:hypothetical protein
MMEGFAFRKGQRVVDPPARLSLSHAARWIAHPLLPPTAKRKMAEPISVQQDGEAYLTKIILTMTSSTSLSRRLDGG